MTNKKHAGGRPTKMTAETISILTDCFRKGLDDESSCCLANISPSVLYSYCKKHIKFAKEKEELKNNLKARAKANVAEAIESKDMITTRWYLERKCKDEYSTKQEVNLDANVSGNLDIQAKLNELSIDELKKLAEGE